MRVNTVLLQFERSTNIATQQCLPNDTHCSIGDITVSTSFLLARCRLQRPDTSNMAVCMACRVLLTFVAVGWITTSDAWWFTKEKPIEEYKFADCEGKRYWTFNSICCEGVVHDLITRDDECCGGYAYTPDYNLCCSGRPVSKAALEKCPDDPSDGLEVDRVS